MLANCFRFAPRDSVPGLIAKICKYLKDHPGWSEAELEEQIRQLVGQTGVASFNGRTGDIILTDKDVNNLKISSAYFAEGNETIEELNLVELYKQGIRFVFTNWNSATSGYDMSFVLDYFSGSGNVVYYPIASASGGSSESPVVSVNSMVGAVKIPVVDVSKTDSNNQFAKIFINESEDYPIAPSYDSDRLGGKPPSYYASSESVTELYNGLAPVAKSGSYNDLNNKPIIPIVPTSLPNPNKLIMTGAVTAEYDGSREVSVEIPASSGSAYELPIASPTTLGGVQPAAKTGDMTQAVGVDEAGGLWTMAGGGYVNEEWEELINVTTTEEVASVGVDLVAPTRFKKIYASVIAVKSSTVGNGGVALEPINTAWAFGSTSLVGWVNGLSTSQDKYLHALVFFMPNETFAVTEVKAGYRGFSGGSNYLFVNDNKNVESQISHLMISTQNKEGLFGVGSKIKIYGVKEG